MTYWKNLQLLGALPPDPYQRLCPWTPLGAYCGPQTPASFSSFFTFSQSHVCTVSRPNLGRLLRDGVERVWAFPSAPMPSWAESETVCFVCLLLLKPVGGVNVFQNMPLLPGQGAEEWCWHHLYALQLPAGPKGNCSSSSWHNDHDNSNNNSNDNNDDDDSSSGSSDDDDDDNNDDNDKDSSFNKNHHHDHHHHQHHHHHHHNSSSNDINNSSNSNNENNYGSFSEAGPSRGDLFAKEE